ncbi:chymotrypsinogen A [Eurytemora carolleeae]|uniref:chymotrypsinogen A n=1 Tax=Eurytemora carolleeae TaxID=1294199 RepID=UPI000C772484|nr:chymotrypsinogen A [Eurytemora carolleeae]|eukprot:XP_023328590.1 chymotrypsinogen A-like [Eurytemora affinis]
MSISKLVPNSTTRLALHALLVLGLVIRGQCQEFVSSNHIGGSSHSHFGCDCMEYWTCILGGGSPHSYCGLTDHDVCCFVPENAAPVGILPSPSATQCGRKGFDSGRDGKAEMGEWPWHVSNLFMYSQNHTNFIYPLLSVPYVSGIREILKVRLGEYDVSTTSEPLKHQEINVSDIRIHPFFNNATLVNDIALLKLEHPAKRKQNIDVVCVPEDKGLDLSVFTNCYVTGWGRRDEESEHSVILKEISVPLWDQSKCNAALQSQFGPSYTLPTSALCAGAQGRDACDGDGGGPLVCEDDGQWFQIGIVR